MEFIVIVHLKIIKRLLKDYFLLPKDLLPPPVGFDLSFKFLPLTSSVTVVISP